MTRKRKVKSSTYLRMTRRLVCKGIDPWYALCFITASTEPFPRPHLESLFWPTKATQSGRIKSRLRVFDKAIALAEAAGD